MSNKAILSKELDLAGAKRSEKGGLIEVANQLRTLNSPRSAYVNAKSSRPWWQRWPVAQLGLSALIGLSLGASIVAYSQTSLPGSWLYPAKRVSEKVAVVLDPSYRATLMMRRSQEVEELIGAHASKPVVLAILADYRTEAAAYKSPNYAAFEYCKNNLEQAAKAAPPPERSAIADALSSLQS